jgi:stress response protein SCP2
MISFQLNAPLVLVGKNQTENTLILTVVVQFTPKKKVKVLNQLTTQAEFVYFSSKKSKNGAVRLCADNRTGATEGDDEEIIVKFSKLDPSQTCIVFGIIMYAGNLNFSQIQNVFVRLKLNSDNKEICRFDIGALGDVRGAVVCRLMRSEIMPEKWVFEAIGAGIACNPKQRRIADMSPEFSKVSKSKFIDPFSKVVKAGASTPLSLVIHRFS